MNPSNSAIRSIVAWLTAGPTQAAWAIEAARRVTEVMTKRTIVGDVMYSCLKSLQSKVRSGRGFISLLSDSFEDTDG